MDTGSLTSAARSAIIDEIENVGSTFVKLLRDIVDKKLAIENSGGRRIIGDELTALESDMIQW